MGGGESQSPPLLSIVQRWLRCLPWCLGGGLYCKPTYSDKGCSVMAQESRGAWGPLSWSLYAELCLCRVLGRYLWDGQTPNLTRFFRELAKLSKRLNLGKPKRWPISVFLWVWNVCPRLERDNDHPVCVWDKVQTPSRSRTLSRSQHQGPWGHLVQGVLVSLWPFLQGWPLSLRSGSDPTETVLAPTLQADFVGGLVDNHRWKGFYPKTVKHTRRNLKIPPNASMLIFKTTLERHHLHCMQCTLFE